MKSCKDDLAKRGLVERYYDVEKYDQFSKEQLWALLDVGIPTERTIAVMALRLKYSYEDHTYAAFLLERLSKEKALYTKIEICNTLESGNEQTALMMCDYLGKIGHNQHTIVPATVSKKKSYPLARDIVARSLGKMDKSICPVLFRQLESGEKTKIAELLDAIGYMVFYNPVLADKDSFNHIQETFERFQKDELLVWKIAVCCAAFPLTESRELLAEIKRISKNDTINLEVKRSLTLINARLNSILSV